MHRSKFLQVRRHSISKHQWVYVEDAAGVVRYCLRCHRMQESVAGREWTEVYDTDDERAPDEDASERDKPERG